jgi:hypothetical protein
VVCPGCVGGSYPFADWRSALRIIYAGEEVDAPSAQTALSATRDCNSDVRRTLVNTWGNLFNGSCGDGNCANGLKHAFRRDDVSGTTAAFLQLLRLPPITTNPFCNGNEIEDRDPIRRACAGNGAQGIPGASGGETVCGFGPTPTTRNPDNTLGTGNIGLVVPVLIPPVPNDAPADFSKYGGNTTLETRNCSSVAFGASGGGAFGRVLWNLADILKYGARCPDGAQPLGGTCLWPKAPGSPAGDQGSPGASGFGCIANQNSRPTGSPSTFDARIYNLWARNSNGTIKTYNRVQGSTAVQRPQIAALYRYRQHNCREEGETLQQACLAVTDTCTIGFGGRSGIVQGGATGLGLREIASAADAFPTEQDAVVDGVYGLARPLYLCELDPTPSDAFPGDERYEQVSGPCPGQDLDNNGVAGDVCYTTDDFVAAQLEIRADLRNNVHTVLDPAAEAGDFFPVPTFNKTCCVGTYSSATDSCQ